MGQTTIGHWAGGSVHLTPSSNVTLRWWWDRRVQVIETTSAGLVMTLQLVNAYKSMPWGDDVIVVVNPKGATHSWSIRDVPGSFGTLAVAAGNMVCVSRVGNGGSAQWWPSFWTVL